MIISRTQIRKRTESIAKSLEKLAREVRAGTVRMHCISSEVRTLRSPTTLHKVTLTFSRPPKTTK